MQTSIEATGRSRHLEATGALRELRRRMLRPQRHRLLHGYPLAAAMPRIGEDRRVDAILPDFDRRQRLLVGVLPHPFCNPAVAGWGFCTFPHEAFTSRKASEVIDHVVREIGRTLRVRPGLAGRPIAGLYFGGGTANLSPPGPFRMLCRALTLAFDLSKAEVTLEGVPSAFLNRRPLLVDILLEELPARHIRLSMGIQTFDRNRLGQMGRLGFGDAGTFREVVRLGHERGFTVSGDLLFNLPAQPLEAMRDDIRLAVDIGLDHLGLYHLVMFDGLGTTWARDPSLVAALPANEEAAENWLQLRALLLGLGFDQTTLTNFERREFRGADRRFLYEESSFRPGAFEMLGFGPSGISYAGSGSTAVKVVNPDGAGAYIEAVGRDGPAWDRAFAYTPGDLRILHLTRRLAALRIERPGYLEAFGTDPIDDFPREFAAMERERLVEVTDDEIRPTATGMFYADSIAGLLAWRRSGGHRVDPGPYPTPPETLAAANDNSFGHM